MDFDSENHAWSELNSENSGIWYGKEVLKL